MESDDNPPAMQDEELQFLEQPLGHADSQDDEEVIESIVEIYHIDTDGNEQCTMMRCHVLIKKDDVNAPSRTLKGPVSTRSLPRDRNDG